MEKGYKMCQSCGMPLKHDPEGGGSHADGSKSAMYCSYCYQGGAFTQPNMTVQEMQKFCIEMMSKKMPKFVAWVLTRNIPRLERWQKNQ